MTAADVHQRAITDVAVLLTNIATMRGCAVDEIPAASIIEPIVRSVEYTLFVSWPDDMNSVNRVLANAAKVLAAEVPASSDVLRSYVNDLAALCMKWRVLLCRASNASAFTSHFVQRGGHHDPLFCGACQLDQDFGVHEHPLTAVVGREASPVDIDTAACVQWERERAAFKRQDPTHVAPDWQHLAMPERLAYLEDARCMLIALGFAGEALRK